MVTEDLAPDESYFVEVFPNASDDNSSYTLTIETTVIPQDPTDDPGETIETAFDLGTLSPAIPEAEAMNFVGTFDNDDFYRFELAQAAQTTFTVSELTDRAQLVVLDAEGGVVASSGTHTSDRVLNLDLPSGEYFARITTVPNTTPDLDENTRYHFLIDPNFSPSILKVFANGTAWAEGFPSDAPEATLGWQIPTGNDNQLLAMPWLGIDQLSLVFSEDVVVAADDLTLAGVNEAVHPLAGSGFDYDPATFTATWTFAAPLGTDRYTIHVASDAVSGVHDTDDNALDGEWDNPTSPFDSQSSQTSGDGSPGGDFLFDFNVLVGDVNGDGEVTDDDVATARNRVGRTVGIAGYNPRYDVNANTGITTADIGLIRAHLDDALPPLVEAAPTTALDPQAVDLVVESMARQREEPAFEAEPATARFRLDLGRWTDLLKTFSFRTAWIRR